MKTTKTIYKNLSISFSEEESSLIAEALKTEKPWKHPKTKDIRIKIRDFHLDLTKKLCCYCRKNFHGEFLFDVDPEHILPSSKEEYRPLSYTIWNLSVACKRCNMSIKNARTDFLNKEHPNIQESEHYLFIHPNFDEYKDHLKRHSTQDDDLVLVKYTIVSNDKGKFTYNYFRLKELEIDSYSEAQGIDIPSQDSEVVSIVKNLASKNNIR